MYQAYSSQGAAANNLSDTYIGSVNSAAGAMDKMNKILANLNTSTDSLYKKAIQLKAYTDTLASNSAANTGKAASAIGSTVKSVATTLGGAYVLGKVLGKGVAKEGMTIAEHGLAAVTKNVLSKTAAKVLGHGVPILGGVVSGATGQGFFSSVATDAAIGGLGGSFAGGIGAVPGALLGAAYGAGGWLLGKGIRSMFGAGGTSGGGSNPKPLSGSQNETQWAKDFLTKIKAPVTDNNIAAVTAWMAQEGGGGGGKTGLGVSGTAMYNPLNTTLGMPGATEFNSAHVKNYTSYSQGLDASIKTLTGSNANAMGYTSIIQSLRANAPAAQTDALASNSGWVTGRTNQDSYHTGSSGGTVNVNLSIAQASQSEVITFAKQVKSILQKDFGIQTMGSK